MARLLRIVAVLGLVAALPLAGAAAAGKPLAPFLELPPRTEAAAPPVFAWPVFAAGLAGVAVVVAPFLWRIARAPASPGSRQSLGPFPWWGWLAVGLLLAAWATAWGAFGGPETLRRHAFTPLWLGYIGAVNAWTYRRAGICLLTHRPGTLVGLLAASVVFWWTFEYLNQFTHSWHYAGLTERGDWGYLLAASPPFATVLAAVISTRDLLTTLPRLSAGLDAAWRPPAPPPGGWPGLALGLGGAGLLAVGVNGTWFFPLLWLAPLLLIWGVQALGGQPTLAAEVASGDWRPLWLAALAALVCGLLWELWNAGSLARWEYAIPYVGGLRLFEMPLLGYAGYLPFGLECVAAAGLVFGGGRRDLRLGVPVAAGRASS